jgi:glutathione S-transferase
MALSGNHLYGIRYSPWTEKARWALDHHKILYRYHEHLMMFGMPGLRWRFGFFRKNLTVPALLTQGEKIIDSFHIAQYADHIGSQEKLFPTECLHGIFQLNELCESALDIARALVLHHMSRDAEAQKEALGFLPKPLRKLLRPMAFVGMSYIRHEFQVSRDSEENLLNQYRRILEDIRTKYRSAGSDYLFGRFSYGDIVCAIALQGVTPVEGNWVPLGSATRRVWSNPELAKEFPDLLERRDRLYAKHRAGRGI